jgi:hypothetical protein
MYTDDRFRSPCTQDRSPSHDPPRKGSALVRIPGTGLPDPTLLRPRREQLPSSRGSLSLVLPPAPIESQTLRPYPRSSHRNVVLLNVPSSSTRSDRNSQSSYEDLEATRWGGRSLWIVRDERFEESRPHLDVDSELTALYR